MLEPYLPYNLTVDLAAVADVVAATSVTTHVLLTKRDVRGSNRLIASRLVVALIGFPALLPTRHKSCGAACGAAEAKYRTYGRVCGRGARLRTRANIVSIR